MAEITLEAAERTLVEMNARLLSIQPEDGLYLQSVDYLLEWRKQFEALPDYIHIIKQTTSRMYDQVVAGGDQKLGQSNIEETLDKAKILFGKHHREVIDLSILYSSCLPSVDCKRHLSDLETSLLSLQNSNVEFPAEHLHACYCALHWTSFEEKDAEKTQHYTNKLVQFQFAESPTAEAAAGEACARTSYLQGDFYEAINHAIRAIVTILDFKDLKYTETEIIAHSANLIGFCIGKTAKSKKSEAWPNAAYRWWGLHHRENGRHALHFLLNSYLPDAEYALGQHEHVPSQDLEELIEKFQELGETMERQQHPRWNSVGFMLIALCEKHFTITMTADIISTGQKLLRDIKSWRDSAIASPNQDYAAEWARTVDAIQDNLPSVSKTTHNMAQQLSARGEKELAMQNLEETLNTATTTVGIHQTTVDLYCQFASYFPHEQAKAKLLHLESSLATYSVVCKPNLAMCYGHLSRLYQNEGNEGKTALKYANLFSDSVETPGGKIQALQLVSAAYYTLKDYKPATEYALLCIYMLLRVKNLPPDLVETMARAAKVIGACAEDSNMSATAKDWYNQAYLLKQFSLLRK